MVRGDVDFTMEGNWSERHAAYAAGLGTFGLCDGLITPVGKAHRTGSVIAGVRLPPSARPYRDHHEYCLHFTHGTCGKCIPRCPVKALGAQGHDKRRCMEYTERAMNRHLKATYGAPWHKAAPVLLSPHQVPPLSDGASHSRGRGGSA